MAVFLDLRTGAPSAEDFTGQTTWDVTILYIASTGKLQVPVAGPEGSESRIVRVAATYGKKIMQWTATREGAMPIIPDPTPSDGRNEELADISINPTCPRLLASGGLHYVASGQYVFLLRKPPDYTKLKVPVAPYNLRRTDTITQINYRQVV
jgi:hypothetical protein